jgi:hypothetical protein
MDISLEVVFVEEPTEGALIGVALVEKRPLIPVYKAHLSRL